MSAWITIAERIAREAGAILREGYSSAKTIEHKGAIDLVTEFDRRSEALIVSALRQAFPEHAIRAEEGSGHSSSGEHEWLVDPLDGTTNFAHGFPVFAVSLALQKKTPGFLRSTPEAQRSGVEKPGVLLVGVVYDPLRDELFAAEAGRGATLNGSPLKVSTQTELSKSLLATGFPYDVRTNPRNNLAQFRQFQLRAQAVRRPGSAALDCCYVAAGRLDGYWEFGMNPWDVGAGALVVREAGGRVTTAQGDEDFLGRDSIVASNGHLHEQMLRVLKEGDGAPLPP
jgi:myo-inositol-1(or 4)-monophosphatase